MDVTYCWLILILQCTGEPLAQLVEARSIGRRGSQIHSPFPCIDDVDELRDVVRGAGEQGLGVAVMNQTAWLKDRFSSVSYLTITMTSSTMCGIHRGIPTQAGQD